MKFIRPEWPAPDSIIAFCTTRENGNSKGPWQGLNMAHHTGDDSKSVALNRQTLARELPDGTVIQWLSQEHGCNIVRAGNTDELPVADGSCTGDAGIACAVLTADCLPVLFCTAGGEKVAAVHAGWRGLGRGVLEACVAAMSAEPSSIIAWLGPAIGPDSFEVGEDVREQFMSTSSQKEQACISRCFKEQPHKPGFYLADLYALARIRLAVVGVTEIYGGELCTFTDKNRFYSYRRDGETGRMASVIAINPCLD